MIYVALGFILVLGATAGYAWVQTSRLETTQAKLEVCATQYDLALKSIAKQNQGIVALETASKQAQERARMAQAASEASRQANTKEISRLKGELGKKPTTTCPAAEAVVKIRQGLK